MANKLFLLSNQYHPTGGGAHSCIAVADLLPSGEVTYERLDFYGTVLLDVQEFLALQLLIVPVSAASAHLLTGLKETMRMEFSMGEKSRYYYGRDYQHDPQFERQGERPVDFTGHRVPWFAYSRDPATHELAADAPPRVMTNCVHFGVNAAMHIADIPLDALDRRFHKVKSGEQLYKLLDRHFTRSEEKSGIPGYPEGQVARLTSRQGADFLVVHQTDLQRRDVPQTLQAISGELRALLDGPSLNDVVPSRRPADTEISPHVDRLLSKLALRFDRFLQPFSGGRE